MSEHGTIRRFTLEIEKIHRGQYPSFREIKDFLASHGFKLSDRTLERDFEQLRVEFGIEVTFNRVKRGYFIDLENSLNPASFFRFLEIVNTAELLTESLIESKNTLKYISFNEGGRLKGIENLKPLLEAIKNQRKISFQHFNFFTGNSRKFTLKPYLLKEYQSRWYIVGILGNVKELKAFGIDRIENLVVMPETFVPDKNLDPIARFEHIIGVVYTDSKPEKVILSFTPAQGNYIKTLPMHQSQQILIDNDSELRIALKVVPNYELIHQILMYGDSITVIEPAWLVKEIKENLIRSLKKYQ